MLHLVKVFVQPHERVISKFLHWVLSAGLTLGELVQVLSGKRRCNLEV